MDRCYAVLLIDAIVIKVRDAQVANRPCYVVIGVNLDGERGVLGLWLGPSGGEGAKQWAAIGIGCVGPSHGAVLGEDALGIMYFSATGDCTGLIAHPEETFIGSMCRQSFCGGGGAEINGEGYCIGAPVDPTVPPPPDEGVHVNEVLADMMFLDVPGRTAKRILELVDHEDEITEPITQQELAAIVPATLLLPVCVLSGRRPE